MQKPNPGADVKGMVSVLDDDDNVQFKIFASTYGKRASGFADILAERGTPTTLEEWYYLAKNLGLGEDGEVIVVSQDCVLNSNSDRELELWGDGSLGNGLHRRYRETFNEPRTNPALDEGDESYITLVHQ